MLQLCQISSFIIPPDRDVYGSRQDMIMLNMSKHYGKTGGDKTEWQSIAAHRDVSPGLSARVPQSSSGFCCALMLIAWAGNRMGGHW